MRQDLAAVVEGFRTNRGVRAKAALRLVGDALGPTDWLQGPGDDTALLELGEERILVAGEAIFPPFVVADPFGAGIAAMVTNVSDVAAMGGWPVALVDTIVAPEHLAREVLRGLRRAGDLYGIPIVGGHLTIAEGPPAVSAFIVGRARRVLAAAAVQPEQTLLAAYCLDGQMHRDFPFFLSVPARGERLARDVAVLPALAADGACVAAKDVSMGGLLGSLAMLLEPTGSGAAVELERVPRPPGVDLARWMATFPTFGFLLCSPPDRAEDCREAFADRGLACEVVGRIDGTGRLRVRLDGEEALLLDVARDGITHLGG